MTTIQEYNSDSYRISNMNSLSLVGLSKNELI